MTETTDAPPEVGHVRVVTPHNRALYEAGKALLIESVTTGREFCKAIASASASAIPIYLALLAFALPKDYRPSFGQSIAFLAPIGGMLLAAVAACMGFFPKRLSITLDVPQDIETHRQSLITHRHTYGTDAAVILLVSIVGAVVDVCIGVFAH